MTRADLQSQTREYVDPVEDKDVVVYPGWQGLRNSVSPEMFGLGDLLVAANVDINDSLDLHRRRGYTAALTTAVDRDIFAFGSICLGVGSNALKQVNEDWSTTTLHTGLVAGRPLTYAPVADRIYWSNGVDSGCVQNGQDRTWGLAPPGAFVVTAGSGALRAGEYQVALTYLRNDGQESGARRATTLSLASTGGLVLSAIPPSVDPTVAYVVIYATSAGGETLYRVGAIANGTTTFVVTEQGKQAFPLKTQFLAPPPAFDFIEYWKGWMLGASGNRLYVSEPYAPELFDLRKTYPFTNRITMLAALNNRTDGTWIGTESQIIFMAGDSPEAWKPNVAAEYGAIPGAFDLFDGDLLGDGAAEGGNTTVIFATTYGLCLGKSDGAFQNLTASRFAYPIQERGALVVRRHGGMIQSIVTMQGAEMPGNVFF